MSFFSDKKNDKYIKQELARLTEELDALKARFKPETVVQEGTPSLEWGEVAPESMSWQEAKGWCEAKGGGWRLPERWELARAFDEKVAGFDGQPSNTFWSATLYNARYAWVVALGSGGANTYWVKSAFQVRCVR